MHSLKSGFLTLGVLLSHCASLQCSAKVHRIDSICGVWLALVALDLGKALSCCIIVTSYPYVVQYAWQFKAGIIHVYMYM